MIALIFLAATASAVPNLDIDKICKSAGDIPGNQGPIAGCVQDEKAAKGRVIKAWSTYSAAARQDCTSELRFDVGVMHVEIETCTFRYSIGRRISKTSAERTSPARTGRS